MRNKMLYFDCEYNFSKVITKVSKRYLLIQWVYKLKNFQGQKMQYQSINLQGKHMSYVTEA